MPRRGVFALCLVVIPLGATCASAAPHQTAPLPSNRFILGPGPEPDFAKKNWLRPPADLGLSTKRILLRPAEAEAIEARLVAWLHDRPGAGRIGTRWASQILLYRKIRTGDRTGDKVAIFGYDESLFAGAQPLTIELLTDSLINDGGCRVWRVLYDVRTRSFDHFECNGVG